MAKDLKIISVYQHVEELTKKNKKIAKIHNGKDVNKKMGDELRRHVPLDRNESSVPLKILSDTVGKLKAKGINI